MTVSRDRAAREETVRRRFGGFIHREFGTAETCEFAKSGCGSGGIPDSEDFAEFDTRELWLVEALRTLRLLHYSAWLASRWRDPAFPAAFPWFGTARYWQDRILELREQIALMDEPPLWSA